MADSSHNAAAEDWKRFDANSIPSKGIELPPIFHETLDLARAGRCGNKPLRILELGCGCGDLSLHLLGICQGQGDTKKEGVMVVGTDINEDAIDAARSKAASTTQANFLVADVTSDRFSCRFPTQFDFVILQLLLSIVGGLEQRRATLANAFDACRPGGWIYLSCSGVSSDINTKYAELYAKDLPQLERSTPIFLVDLPTKSCIPRITLRHRSFLIC